MFFNNRIKHIKGAYFILITESNDHYIQLLCCLNLAFVYIRHVIYSIRMATLKAVILCSLVHSVICDPLDINEDWGAALWSTAGDLWEDASIDLPGTDSLVNGTFNSSNFTSLFTNSDIVWMPPNVTNVSSTFVLDSGSFDSDVIGLTFQKEEADFAIKLNSFFDNLFGISNQTNPETWTFVSFITIMPLRCSEVQKVVALFDAAMQEANPDAQIASKAQKLGSSACGGDGLCPCTDVRRYSKRVMEVRSTSRSKTLVYPSKFPYPLEIHDTLR